MFNQPLPGMAGVILGLTIMMTPAAADPLKDEIAPTGKLRVAIAISPAGGAFWSTKTETGYAGVPVDLGKAMAEQLGVPVEYVAHNNSGQIVDAVSKGTWDITFLPKDPEREGRMSFGPIYEVADATYIVKPGSTVTNFATLDQATHQGRGRQQHDDDARSVAHLKNAKVTGYQTYDEIFGLLKGGEIDAFALSRDQLNAMAQADPGHARARRNLQADGDGGSGAAQSSAGTGVCGQVSDESIANGTLRKAYDNNGLKDRPVRTKAD